MLVSEGRLHNEETVPTYLASIHFVPRDKYYCLHGASHHEVFAAESNACKADRQKLWDKAEKLCGLSEPGSQGS